MYVLSKNDFAIFHFYSHNSHSAYTGLPHYKTPHYNKDFNITRSCHGSHMVTSYCSYVKNLIITLVYLEHSFIFWTPKIAL